MGASWRHHANGLQSADVGIDHDVRSHAGLLPVVAAGVETQAPSGAPSGWRAAPGDTEFERLHPRDTLLRDADIEAIAFGRHSGACLAGRRRREQAAVAQALRAAALAPQVAVPPRRTRQP